MSHSPTSNDILCRQTDAARLHSFITDRGDWRCQCCGYIKRYWWANNRTFMAVKADWSDRVIKTCGYHACIRKANRILRIKDR